ncbi:MAG: 2-isopropylmalate synthase [Rhodospirillaceae bacterium]
MKSTNPITQGDPNRVVIFDTTLRDGEQSPGASMNLEEKLRIARVLEEMGVDVIEAGFPIASDGDFESVSKIAKVIKNSTVTGLARAARGDIERAGDAVKHAERPRIHTFIATSPLHMQYKLQMDPDQVLERITDSVTTARNLCDDVEWSAEDGSRSELDFLCKAVELAIKAGATTINIPDTVGYAVPEEYAQLIADLIERVPNSDQAIFSVHCHNDLGLAVANSLAAIKAGARQVECTINGLGERAGNCSLEEVVMGLRTRQDVMPFSTGVDATHITRVSRMVSSVTGFPVQPNKAIVGANAFAHESGIHQDGMLKHAQTYEIMTPESVGLTKSKIVLGKHSGRNAFNTKLAEMGYKLGDNALNEAFKRFKDLADLKKDVFDEDLVALVDDETRVNDRIRLVSLEIRCGTVHTPPKASMTLNIDGAEKSCDGTGDGPVDAAFNCIKTLFPHDSRLQLFQVHAVTQGTDAQAEVTVRLDDDGERTAQGAAADTDTMVAAVKAYVNALNKLLTKREKSAPEAMSA